VQTQGSLAQTNLASLLEAMQSERATGTLSLQQGAEGCSLFFLFGHLFHATGDLGQGEEAVINALGWTDGSFTFDPRAKLPAEETIKAATGELLEEAERRSGGVHAESNGSGPSGEGGETEAEQELAAVPAAVEAPAASHDESGGNTPAWTAATRDAVRENAVTETLAAGPAPAAQQPTNQVFGAPDAPPLTDLYPLPSGKPIYEGLKSAFVDFPKLLRTLDSDKHTGYVRLDGADFAGVLLLHDGHVLEALFSAGELTQGDRAFQNFRRRMERGEGLLDVIELAGETVVALAQLLTARPLFTGLLGRFVNFGSLLEYLAEEKVDGSLVVTGGTETGVILLRKGQIHGAYTQSQRDLVQNPGVIDTLGSERSARIEVKAGAGSPPGIDIEAALRATF
jgi:hypothetical protein